jgi:penicillin-binding protein 1C
MNRLINRLRSLFFRFARLKIVRFLAWCVLFFYVLNFFYPAPDEPAYSTIVEDRDGNIVHVYLTPDDKIRLPTELSEVSDLLRKTIINKEDQYFYYHVGVNPIAIIRAMFGNVTSGQITSGASTITMQTARMLEPKPRTYFNKVIEMFRAIQLELKYSKDEILRIYCNLLPYGGNIEGIKSAAYIYLDKNPNYLSLAEITALSIIPNNPSHLTPGKHNPKIIRKRNEWLAHFKSEKIFPEKELTNALKEPFDPNRKSLPKEIPHLSRRLKDNGQRIHTFIDMQKQKTAEQIVREYCAGLKLLNINNASVIILDNKTNEIVSYVGSGDFYDNSDGGQVDGVKAIRQPGSTLKPLLYALGIDKGLITPKMIIEDVPINYDGYTPENYDRNFYGLVSMKFALGQSLNVPAVKMLHQMGPNALIEKLVDCEFNQIKKDRNKLGLSLTLGGCGTSLEELTALFSVFAQKGRYVRPKYIRTTDTSTYEKQIVSPSASFMITDILSQIQRPDFPIHWQTTSNLPKIAWKTGTSYGRRDAWSIGYNRDYTVGVWVGNFSAQGNPDLSGASTATPLLFKIFNSINYGDDLFWFNKPSNCELRTVCSESGMPPSNFCEHLVSDYFIPLVSPTKNCNHKKEVFVNEDETMSYCIYCKPTSNYKTEWYSNHSADIINYKKENGQPLKSIPFHNPDCPKIIEEGGPRIISPQSVSEYLLNRNDPEPVQLKCKVSQDVQTVYWYINNELYKKTNANSPLFFVPEKGKSLISCTDDKGRSKSITITVAYVDF